MENRSRIIEKIIVYVIVALVVFTAGVFVGKKVEQQKNEKAEETFEEGGNVEEFPMEPETISEPVEVPTQEVKPEVTTSSNTVQGNQTVSENTTPAPELSASENAAANKPKWNDAYVDSSEQLTLEQRNAVRSSYEETMLLNQQDRKIIEESTVDFSNMKIAFLGDSITEGFEGMTPYPYLLKEQLGVKEIYNLGKGGSTITTKTGDGTYSMAERVDQIPKDADVIIVLGGTNDNFYQKEWQYGFLDWESKGDGTFCGGVQLLMKRLNWIYPDSHVLFFVPPSNARVDELKVDDPGLQDFAKYAEAISYIGREEKIQVVDLYNQNFMNSHDATIRSKFMRDKVHCNSEGNKVLAERIGAEIIKRFQ